jgi:hypothetical protein
MRCLSTRLAQWLFAAGTVLSVAGCGGTGAISGKVTLGGKPLPGGLITVYDSATPDEPGAVRQSCVIGTDGTYTVGNIPTGPAVVVIETVPALPDIMNPRNKPHEMFGPYVAIPLHYKDRAKSGFTIDIKKGSQSLDLPLEEEPKEAAKP